MAELRTDRPWLSAPCDSIAAGNHANAIGILGLTPAGAEDVFVTGGNWGMPIRPSTPLRERTSRGGDHLDLLRRLAAERAVQVADTLLDAGFHVRAPGKSRVEPPRKWNRDSWIGIANRPKTGASW